MVKKTKKNGFRGKPGPGRPKGSMNRFTTMKQSFIEAFDALGGTAGLIAWAKASPKNRRDFYSWVARMLPADINLNPEPERKRVLIIREYAGENQSEVNQ